MPIGVPSWADTGRSFDFSFYDRSSCHVGRVSLLLQEDGKAEKEITRASRNALDLGNKYVQGIWRVHQHWLEPIYFTAKHGWLSPSTRFWKRIEGGYPIPGCNSFLCAISKSILREV